MWIYGNGGHAKVVRALVCAGNIVDDNDPRYPWKLEYWEQDGLVAIGDNKARKSVVQRLEAKRYTFRQIYSWQRSPGTVVMQGAVVQPGSELGEHCIINTCSSVDHDCRLGDFVHIAPGAHLCGNVEVGEGTLVGAGTIVTPGISIGSWLVIPAGSVVTKDCLNETDVASLRRR